MSNKWSLYVKDFGRIKEAEFAINDMMIFVGDNSSGKSYIMTLLWGLITHSEMLLEYTDITTLESYNKCSDWLTRAKKEKVIANSDIQGHFIDLFNELLSSSKDYFVQNIFNSDLSIGELKIVNYQGSDIEYVISLAIQFRKFKIDWMGRSIPVDATTLSEEITKIDVFRLCQEFIFEEVSPDIFEGYNSLYFPSARTGFTLTYKTLFAGMADSAFSSNLIEKRNKSALSKPVISFLQSWMRLSDAPISTESKLNGVVEYLEDNLIKGLIKRNNMPVLDISFNPKGSSTDIPIHMTSSLITELAPIALFLKYGESTKTVIIEEPEAHLHLKAQMVMAKFLAKLLNNGTNV